jgi:hypothetical protein
MVERLLHELQITGLAQQLAPEIMPIIVEAEIDDASSLDQAPPHDLNARIGEGMPLALRPPVTRTLRHVGEDVLWMVPAQRPQDRTNL